jgi:hypothetical protein
MTPSLKSIVPELARIFGETPDALYERQRSLDREGLLKSVPGKGPGTGVRATPEAVAMLTIAVMMGSVSLLESGTRARFIAKARVGIAGELFKDALARILSDEALAARVTVIRVAVTAGLAQIEFEEKSLNAVFLGKRPENLVMRIDVAIGADTVRALAKVVSGLK